MVIIQYRSESCQRTRRYHISPFLSSPVSLYATGVAPACPTPAKLATLRLPSVW